MVFFRYSGGDELNLYDDDFGDPPASEPGVWDAPVASGRLDARIEVPGSKSLTNRELVLAALGDAPTRLVAPLHARDTALMIDALRELGCDITRKPNRENAADDLVITPAAELTGGVSVQCGLAGTVMRFVPPVAALARGPVAFDGDAAARSRPMLGTITALRQLGVAVHDDGRGRLPFSLHGTGEVAGGDIDIDASESSQFVSGLLLAAPRFAEGLTLTHTGASLPSLPHITMTLDRLRARGVAASARSEHSWRVEPGPIAGGTFTVEPDLSNAAPFLIAAVIAGGEVRIPNWPAETTQVGDLLRTILPQFGAELTLSEGTLHCRVDRGILDGARPAGVDLDLTVGGELAPNLAGLLALCEGESQLRGIGHLRGHETDRLAALASELNRVGAHVTETSDGLRIRPGALHGARWQCYGDHRMATTGALIGLATEGVTLDDVACTTKTLPDFPGMWATLLGASDDTPPVSANDLLGVW